MTKTLDVPKAQLTAGLNPVAQAQALIEAGVDPKTLGEMMTLQERWEAREAAKEFALAMNACQTAMPTVIRDKRNNETGKLYAPLETIKTWAKPIYTKHGFSLSFTSEAGATKTITYSTGEGGSRTEENTTTTVHLDVTHIGGHTKRTTLPDVPLDDKGPKGGAVKTQVQGLMSSMSYAQGRLICLAFNITVADEDRDGQLGGTETITDEQAEEISRLLDETKTTRGRFFDWLKITAVKEIKARDLPKVMGHLEDKLRQNGGGK